MTEPIPATHAEILAELEELTAEGLAALDRQRARVAALRDQVEQQREVGLAEGLTLGDRDEIDS